MAKTRRLTKQSGTTGGPKTYFRNKLRQRPASIGLTEVGWQCLRDGAKRRGMSRSDYVESLLRKDNGVSLRYDARGDAT